MKPRQFHAAALADVGSGGLRLQVAGDCMRPALRDGEEVAIVHRRPRPGDIVAIRCPDGRLLLHRFLGWRPPVLGATGWALATKADDAKTLDPAVSWSDFLGVVNSYRPGPIWRARATTLWLTYAVRALLRRSSAET